MLRDACLVVRRLLQAPWYAAAVVLTLALAVGATTAIYSAVHAVLLAPLPVRQPDRVVICWERDPARSLSVVELSYRNFEDWTAHSRSFSRTAAMGSSLWPAVLDEQGASTRLSSAGVSVSFFDALGVAPEHGRGFRPEDDAPMAPRVVVLSHALWATRFSADPLTVGRTIRLDDDPHTIVGVMPDGFDVPRGADVWTPVVPILARSAGEWRTDALGQVGVLFVVGRLRDGVTPGMAKDELDRLAADLDRAGGAHRFGAAVVVTPLLDVLVGPVRQALWASFAAVGVLLLIACVNVSGLMLMRVSLGRRDQAVRQALGAPVAALIRPWVFEALLMSIAGGVLGLLASVWLAQAIVALAPEDVPRLSRISLNLPVAAFALGTVLLTALLCGAGPVRQARAANALDALVDGSRSTGGVRSTRARSVLLVLQTGFTVALMVAAGLVGRSFVNLRTVDLGFVPSNLLTLSVGPRAPEPSVNHWVQQLLARVTALSDVDAAGAVSLRPLALGSIGQETWVVLEGQTATPEGARQNPLLNYQVATPGYFTAMRIPLERGRPFDARDDVESPRVALVSRTMARRLWPGDDPLGKRLLMPSFTPDHPGTVWRTVVGVVGDVRYRGLDDVRLDVYDAAPQAPVAATDLVIRTAGDPWQLAGAVRTEARRLDPRVVVDRLTTMDAVVSRAVAPWRFSAWILTLFAIVAFTFATVGLLSVVGLDVAARRREIAIRLALGARRRDVSRSVLVRAGVRLLPGIALGVLLASAGTRGLRALLFGVEALDGATYAAVVAVVLATTVVASWLPARRAASVDPVVLLRRE